MFAHDLHVSLAVATYAIVAVAAIEAAVRVVTGRPPGRFSAAMTAITLVVVGMTAAGGLAILTRGERPREFLHFIYAVLVFALIPLGDSLTARASARGRAMTRLLAALLALIVIVRLFATG